MNLTGQIVRKDFFRLRWILLLWAVVLTAMMAMARIQVSLGIDQYYPFYLLAWVFGKIFLPLLGFGLVMGVVNDDAVSDTDAFWITRPISSGRLLGAKCATLALLCLVPALVMIPWWIAQGMDLHQFGAISLQVLRWQAFLTVLAVPFAVISINAGRFFMSVVLSAAGSFLLILIFVFVTDDAHTPLSPEVISSTSWVMLGWWVIATGVIALNQFLTRRTRFSIVVLIAVLLVNCAVAHWWSWNIFPATNGAEVASVAALRLESAASGRDSKLQLEYKADPVKGGGVLLPTKITHQLIWPNDSLSIESYSAANDQLAKACSAVALGAVGEAKVQSEFVLT
ncbi:MAG: hypothetical protein JWM32_91, partial [Verrucomicrobia bacterium]|nr:hypothetical protein [Verrucomicrobiota bacterium]